MNELQLSQNIEVITAEINAYQRVAGEAIFEIGRRLKHVKENDLVHGEFGKWLESINMTHQHANRFMKVVDELGESKYTSMFNLGIATLYQIATLPPEQREAEHVTVKGETKTPDEMTVKELRELNRQLKNEQKAREQAEKMALFEQKEREKLEKELNSQKPLVKEVVKEIEIIKEVDRNQDEIKRLKYENTLLKDNERASAEIIRSYEESYQQLKEKEEEHEKLRKQVEAMTRGQSDFSKEMESTIIAAKMNGEVRAFFMKVMSPLKYQLHLSDISHNETAKESIEETLNLLKRWTDEIEGFIGNKNKRNNTIIIEG